MNGADITLFLKDNTKFGSVLAVDLLQHVKTGKAYVINTKPSYTRGRHWVVLDMTGSKPFFFDSFGNSPSFYNLPPCEYSHKRIQDEDAESCGIYCIYYITMGRKGLAVFGKNAKKNDKYVLRWFIKKKF